MTRRFYIGAALTVPVFVLAMAHMIPAPAIQSLANSHTSRWLQFALTVPVVAWAGWPFFRRGWRSVVTRHLNMFTLIAIGVGAARSNSTENPFALPLVSIKQNGGEIDFRSAKDGRGRLDDILVCDS